MENEPLSGATEARKNDAGKTFDDAAAAVQGAARKMGEQAADIGGQVYEQARDAGRAAAHQVEEQPWIAALAAGVLGLAIGVLIGRASVPAPRTPRDYVDEYLPRRLRQR